MTRITLRRRPGPSDPAAVRRLTRASGGFSNAEIGLAVELVKERLARGLKASGYHFLFAESRGELLGYACFGPIPLTRASWDLYWIAVTRPAQGRGIGRRLLQACQKSAAAAGARRLYADTSGRRAYARTRAFYRRAGFRAVAKLADFYAPGDAKLIYAKALRRTD